jgi:hypothetical protein
MMPVVYHWQPGSYQLSRRVRTDKRACGHLEGWPPDSGQTKTTPAGALVLRLTETYAAEGTSSLRNDMLKDCVFGTYRAAAPKCSFLSAGSRYLEFVVTSIDSI